MSKTRLAVRAVTAGLAAILASACVYAPPHPGGSSNYHAHQQRFNAYNYPQTYYGPGYYGAGWYEAGWYGSYYYPGGYYDGRPYYANNGGFYGGRPYHPDRDRRDDRDRDRGRDDRDRDRDRDDRDWDRDRRPPVVYDPNPNRKSPGEPTRRPHRGDDDRRDDRGDRGDRDDRGGLVPLPPGTGHGKRAPVAETPPTRAVPTPYGRNSPPKASAPESVSPSPPRSIGRGSPPPQQQSARQHTQRAALRPGQPAGRVSRPARL